MKPFLFSYISGGQRVYKLVYSHSASEAKTKLKKVISYLSNSDIKLETILEN